MPREAMADSDPIRNRLEVWEGGVLSLPSLDHGKVSQLSAADFKVVFKSGSFWPYPADAVKSIAVGALGRCGKQSERLCACYPGACTCSATILNNTSCTSSEQESGDGCEETTAAQKKKTRRGTKAGRQVKERRIKATAKREAKAYAALATPAFNAPPPPPFGYIAPPITVPPPFHLEVDETSEGVATLPQGLLEPLVNREKE
eukprot:evm.model.scf_159.8 EVM.evm.TU.scf_159.8   scf_159:104324-105698(+)